MHAKLGEGRIDQNFSKQQIMVSYASDIKESMSQGFKSSEHENAS